METGLVCTSNGYDKQIAIPNSRGVQGIQKGIHPIGEGQNFGFLIHSARHCRVD